MNIIDIRNQFNFNRATRSQTVGIIIHHTAGGEGGLIPSIRNTGNGYHYAIRPNGEVLHLLTDNLQAWHAGRTTQPRFSQTNLPQVNPNSTTIGIAFIGNFVNSLPTNNALEACDDLVRMLSIKYTTLMYVYGHICVTATSCPGQINWQRWRRIVLESRLINNDMEEVETEMRYNTINEVPTWARDTIQKLIDKGLLQGDDGNLNLSEDMIRMFVINDRAGLYS